MGRRSFRLVTVVLLALSMLAALPGTAAAGNGSRVSGTAVPFPVAPDTCDPTATGPVDYILAMPEGSGDLTGCLYGVRGPVKFSKGGTVSVRNTETFVGCLGDLCGSFDLVAHITSKWDGLPGQSNQVFGRCQHKIVPGSGTGDFEGATGRLDFKDIIERDADGNSIGVEFDYRGSVRL